MKKVYTVILDILDGENVTAKEIKEAIHSHPLGGKVSDIFSCQRIAFRIF